MTVEFDDPIGDIAKNLNRVSTKSVDLVKMSKKLMEQMDDIRELITMYFEAKDWFEEVKEFRKYTNLTYSELTRLNWNIGGDTDVTKKMCYWDSCSEDVIPIYESAYWECTCATQLLRKLGITVSEEGNF